MKYIVWKRNDGYIGASCGSLPNGWITGGAYKTFEGAGKEVTFEQLAEFDDWQKVLDFIRETKLSLTQNTESCILPE